MLVQLQEAQSAFETLPPPMQLPTLSPLYCAADARRDSKLRPRFLLFRSGDALLLHSVQEADVPGGGGTDWQSPYGYGGPLAAGMTEPVMQAAWAQFNAVARECGVIAEFVRFHPRAANHRFYPGAVHDDRPVVTVDLSAMDVAATYTTRGRNSLRKAQRAGLVASWTDPARCRDEFIELYHEAMQRIGAGVFYLFGPEYFESLLDLPYARVLEIRHSAQIVAAAVFLRGPTVLEYQLSASSPQGRSLGATNLLVHEAACMGQREGLKSLYLGGGTDSRPDNPLLRFKESFAPARDRFRFGSRVLNAEAYDTLRQRFPRQARSGRILFYRDN